MKLADIIKGRKPKVTEPTGRQIPPPAMPVHLGRRTVAIRFTPPKGPFALRVDGPSEDGPNRKARRDAARADRLHNDGSFRRG